MATNNNDTIGNELREAFKSKGWTMLKLSRECGLAFSTIHAFIASERPVMTPTATKIAEALGLEIRVASRRRSTPNQKQAKTTRRTRRTTTR